MKIILKKILKIEMVIILIAVAIGVYAYYPTFTNNYIIADDARVSYFWAPKFQDKDLFNNDLLTKESINRYPWGYVFIFYLSSFFIDPILFGTILSIFLLAVCAYYLFKIGEHISGRFLGIICALSFLTTQTYIGRMAGGLARSFGYPLMIMFLFCLIKKDYFKTTVAMILQCLFYPMLFLISILVFSFSFIKLPLFNGLVLSPSAKGKNTFWDKFSFSLNRLRIFDVSADKMKYFIFAIIICGSIIFCKQFLMKNPEMGAVYTKSEMIKMPEFYRGAGKWYDGLPTRPVMDEIEPNIMMSNIFLTGIIKFCLFFFKKNTVTAARIFTYALLLFFLIELFRKKIKVPKEIFILPFVGALLYKLADIFLFKLYVPNRYLIYSVQIAALIIFPIAINSLILKTQIKKLKMFFQVIVIAFIFFNFHLYRPTYLLDVSENKHLYEFLNTLPKNTLIAANPFISDNIPLYSKRKVFLSDESAVALYKKYWEKMKKRIFGFYNFYYSENPLEMFKFCKINGIEYIVVNKKNFSDAYLRTRRFFSEPFNRFVSYLVNERSDFVLKDVPEELKLFAEGDVFVLHRNAFLLLAENKNGTIF